MYPDGVGVALLPFGERVRNIFNLLLDVLPGELSNILSDVCWVFWDSVWEEITSQGCEGVEPLDERVLVIILRREKMAMVRLEVEDSMNPFFHRTQKTVISWNTTLVSGFYATAVSVAHDGDCIVKGY